MLEILEAHGIIQPLGMLVPLVLGMLVPLEAHHSSQPLAMPASRVVVAAMVMAVVVVVMVVVLVVIVLVVIVVRAVVVDMVGLRW